MANEKQLDNELVGELQERIDALNSESVMDAGVLDGFLTAHALNPEHPSKHDVYPYIFSAEGDPAALPEDDRIIELLDIPRVWSVGRRKRLRLFFLCAFSDICLWE